MAGIIASTYEVIQELGSGGGGVVYLANHIRLNKQVVLKADKRKITTRAELLRREVDVLKDLHNPYIPQVYDFFAVGDTVYTAMDFVDGESLDKPLKRGERFSQSQVIRWAKQILEALVYLHRPTHGTPPRGYVHSDIKPANLMLRENGDICLIDFNISLALGEENAIGASAGYASPEHYGLDFSFRSSTVTQGTETLPLNEGTVTLTMPATTSGYRRIVPDVRSDIYSTGATLYHLLSGRRPKKNAIDVVPLSEQEVSPQIAAIISKAMNPNADLRYQSAAEMLWALEHLQENDPRSIRLKRCKTIMTAVLLPMFIISASMTFIGLKQMEQAQAKARAIAESSERALAAISDSKSAYQSGDIPRALQFATEALALDSPYTPQAQKALTDALGVYELSDTFRSYRSLTLPSAPFKIALSPNGTKAAAIVSGQMLAFDLQSGEQLAAFPANPSALSDVVFLGDEALLYAGDNALRAYDLDQQREIWSGDISTSISVSTDGSTAAAVYKDESTATIYDAHTGEVLQTVSFVDRHQTVLANDVFADPEDDLFTLNGKGTWLAASFYGGGLALFDLRDGAEEITIFDSSDYTHFEGGFFGQYFAFSATREGESVFAVLDTETLEQTGGFSSTNPFHVQADDSGILVSTENLLVDLHPVTGDQKELAYANADITGFAQRGEYTLVALADGSTALYDKDAKLMETWEDICDFLAMSGDFALTGNRDTPSLRVLRVETHPEAQVLTYDRDFLHDEARLTNDGGAMLYCYDRFRIYGGDGTLLIDAELPDSAQVYDQQYRRNEDGDYLEVIYNDGTVRSYSAGDGRLLSEKAGTPLDGSLDEEFLTDKLRITAPLHGAAVAYDQETGELVRELEKNDYLTYATQVGEYVITEYVTAQGKRYGLLLNEDCETLAELPGLCDILPDGTLVFDDMRGNLRKSPIYSLEELIAFAGAGG